MDAIDQRLMSIFGEGRATNDRGDYPSANPHSPGTIEHDAWATGWQEAEGPTYSVTDAGRAMLAPRRGATLADIWPTA